MQSIFDYVVQTIKYKICNGMLAASKSVVIYMFTNWNHYDAALMSYYSTSYIWESFREKGPSVYYKKA